MTSPETHLVMITVCSNISNTCALISDGHSTGGMDVYVREFADPLHDTFYTNDKILSIFLNYTTQVVKRYVDKPSIFSWEIANDPRCNSTLPSTNGCTTKTITKWHAKVSDHITTIDPNHLVSSGFVNCLADCSCSANSLHRNQGFLCTDCPKLFTQVTPPAPQTSSTPGRRSPKPITKRGLLEERRLAFKKTRAAKKREVSSGGVSIRGMWKAPETRRQTTDQGIGPAFDGTFGIDSEDILNIPNISFGTFQLFPDQASYGPNDPSLSSFENVVQQGSAWIQRQADIARLYVRARSFQCHAPNCWSEPENPYH